MVLFPLLSGGAFQGDGGGGGIFQQAGIHQMKCRSERKCSLYSNSSNVFVFNRFLTIVHFHYVVQEGGVEFLLSGFIIEKLYALKLSTDEGSVEGSSKN